MSFCPLHPKVVCTPSLHPVSLSATVRARYCCKPALSRKSHVAAKAVPPVLTFSFVGHWIFGHWMNSYVEALIDIWEPGMPSPSRVRVLRRVPSKCMSVPIPPSGIRAALSDCLVSPTCPGTIHGLSREEALLLALLRFDDASPTFFETVLYITSQVPPSTISLTVPPSPFALGATVPEAWLSAFTPNELCLVYARDNKDDDVPHLHFCAMQMAADMPKTLVRDVRKTMLEQSVYANVVESKGVERRGYHCFGLRPCYLPTGGVGSYCLDHSKCRGLSLVEVTNMQDSWFSSYDAMQAHMLLAVAEVNEALAAAQMSHMRAHHLHANGIRLMHGWASTLFNSSPDFWKAPHVEEERDCFQALGWYLQSVPHKTLPHIGETIDVEVQELPTADGPGDIIWKKGEVLQHLTAISFKARINNEFDFIQIYHLSQEDVEWRRVVPHHAARAESMASTPSSLSVAVFLDAVLCVKVLSFLRASQPETLLCAGAVCRLWRQCSTLGALSVTPVVDT